MLSNVECKIELLPFLEKKKRNVKYHIVISYLFLTCYIFLKKRKIIRESKLYVLSLEKLHFNVQLAFLFCSVKCNACQ